MRLAPSSSSRTAQGAAAHAESICHNSANRGKAVLRPVFRSGETEFDIHFAKLALAAIAIIGTTVCLTAYFAGSGVAVGGELGVLGLGGRRLWRWATRHAA